MRTQSLQYIQGAGGKGLAVQHRKSSGCEIKRRAAQADSLRTQVARLRQALLHLLIPVVPPHLAPVLQPAPFYDPLNNEGCASIHVQLCRIHIPEEFAGSPSGPVAVAESDASMPDQHSSNGAESKAPPSEFINKQRAALNKKEEPLAGLLFSNAVVSNRGCSSRADYSLSSSAP